jgi:hypothetical protein
MEKSAAEHFLSSDPEIKKHLSENPQAAESLAKTFINMDEERSRSQEVEEGFKALNSFRHSRHLMFSYDFVYAVAKKNKIVLIAFSILVLILAAVFFVAYLVSP